MLVKGKVALRSGGVQTVLPEPFPIDRCKQTNHTQADPPMLGPCYVIRLGNKKLR